MEVPPHPSPTASTSRKRSRSRSPDPNDGGEEPREVKLKKRLIKVKQLREKSMFKEMEESDLIEQEQPLASTSALPQAVAGDGEVEEMEMEDDTTPKLGGTDLPATTPPPSPGFTILGSSHTNNHHNDPTPSTSHQPPPLPHPIPRSHLCPPRSKHPPLTSCRSVYTYTRLNHIEEGTYGIVFRARCNETGGIYALKKLKLEEEKQGFPITSLREVMALIVAGGHENVVGVREIVVGDTLNQIFIVMPFIEHDLKTLLENMPHPFLQSEVKTLMLQILSAVAHCHSNWILHRDLKTSNLLMNNRGQIKIADFGLARKFGDPLGEMTQLVVTLWYRSPELLLGAKDYSTAVDVWSIGCIFAELMQKDPLFPGRGEIDQIGRIFNLLGKPSEDMWPGFSRLPLTRSINPIGPPYSSLRKKFEFLSPAGQDLLADLLTYDPEQRISAEAAGKHPYFDESPYPKHPDLFSSFPSIAAGEKRQKIKSPTAPMRAISKPGQKEFDLV